MNRLVDIGEGGTTQARWGVGGTGEHVSKGWSISCPNICYCPGIGHISAGVVIHVSSSFINVE